MNRESHSLQSLLLGVHTDVSLHLNTPQTKTQKQDTEFYSPIIVIKTLQLTKTLKNDIKAFKVGWSEHYLASIKCLQNQNISRNNSISVIMWGHTVKKRNFLGLQVLCTSSELDLMITDEVLVLKWQGASEKLHWKLEILEGLHWWIASIFRGLFPQNEMPCKHDWASHVAIAHTKKDCRSFIHLLGKKRAVSEAKQQ